MDGEEGGGIRLSKRFNDNSTGGGEVDYKNKSGTAWSHSYLNQKPWHPLSYPNQRRKWISEQTHAHRQRRADEVSREYAQEQEFFRQTALISKKEKEKVELMQAVSFMYVRPPGYNAESAKAAEMADEKRKEELSKGTQEQHDGGPSSSMPPSSLPGKDHLGEGKKKPRPKDVFGRPLPTEEEFEILKNAPRLETGVAGRVKPFGVEVRNVKCLRCGTYGHQSGDRECPLKDAIMPNEESRLKRDDPLNAILAQTDPTEPLKWELKQKPGISPPRGGFRPDDPNQQIVAEEDIFDEYGGFLGRDNIPDLLTNFSKKPKSKKSKRKKQQLNSEREASSDDGEKSSKKKKVKVNKKKHDHAKSSSSDASDFQKGCGKSRHRSSYSSENSDSGRGERSRKAKHEHSFLPKDSDRPSRGSYKSRDKHFYSSEDSDSDRDERSRKNIQKHKRKHSRKRHSYSSDDSKNSEKHSHSSEDSDSNRDYRSRKNIRKHKRKLGRKRYSYLSEDADPAGHCGNHRSRDEHSYSSDVSDHQRQPKGKRSSHKHSSTAHWDSQKHNRDYDLDRYNGDQKRRSKHSYSSEDSDVNKDDQSRKVKQKHRYIPEGSEHPERDKSNQRRKNPCYSSRDSGADGYHRSEKRRYEHSYSSESDDSDHHHQRHSRRHGYKH